MINILRIPSSMFNYLVRNGMVRQVGEYEPTIKDVIKKRKSKGGSYENAIKEFNDQKKL